MLDLPQPASLKWDFLSHRAILLGSFEGPSVKEDTFFLSWREA